MINAAQAQVTMKDSDQRQPREAGFSVAEVLVAVFVITVGLVGLAGPFPVASQSVSTSNLRTNAALLAEQQIETVKNTALTNWAGVAAKDEMLASGYNRITVVTPVAGNPNLLGISVTVTVPNQTSVQLDTFVANRI